MDAPKLASSGLHLKGNTRDQPNGVHVWNVAHAQLVAGPMPPQATFFNFHRAKPKQRQRLLDAGRRALDAMPRD